MRIKQVIASEMESVPVSGHSARESCQIWFGVPQSFVSFCSPSHAPGPSVANQCLTGSSNNGITPVRQLNYWGLSLDIVKWFPLIG